MKIKSVTSGNKANNEAEYKKVLKKRNRIYLLLFLVGALTFVFTFFAKSVLGSELNGHTKNFYMGVGSGIMVASIVLIIQGYLILNNEVRLKRERLKENDERNIAIGHLAWKWASSIFILCIYFIGIIMGIYNVLYLIIAVGLASSFILLYGLFYWYLNKKM